MRTMIGSLLSFVFIIYQAHATVIAVPENAAPWGLTADLPPGQRGIYADLADAVARHTKAPIAIKFVPYGRMLEGVRLGEFDYAFGVVSPITSTAAPFTAVIAKVPMMAVARKGLSLKTVGDLRNFAEVGYLRGGSCGALIDDDRAIHRVSQDSYLSAIRKLSVGRLDAWCSIRAGFIYTLNKTDLAEKIGDQLNYGEVEIGLQVTRSKLDTTEAKDVGAVIDLLLKEGTVGKIFSQYVGTSYNP